VSLFINSGDAGSSLSVSVNGNDGDYEEGEKSVPIGSFSSSEEDDDFYDAFESSTHSSKYVLQLIFPVFKTRVSR